MHSHAVILAMEKIFTDGNLPPAAVLRGYDHVCTGYLAFRQLSVAVGGDTGGALQAAEQRCRNYLNP